jgi:hypothetical protein
MLRLTPGKIILAFLIVGVSGIYFVCLRPHQLSGKVISANTNMPISGALIAIESGNPWDESAMGEYVQSDQFGNFTAQAKGSWVSFNAWKQGYAMSGALYGAALGRAGKENIIPLRELTPTNRLEVHDQFYALVPGTGFSFSAGKVVKGDSSEADFVIAQDLNKKSVAFIETPDGGEIQSQQINETTDFYNSPIAPVAHYQRRLVVPANEMTLYFLRTRDGRHYAKFRFMADVVMTPQGAKYVDLENVRLIWAYQVDGTRNLEIKPNKNMPFPFYKFGFSPASISE